MKRKEIWPQIEFALKSDKKINPSWPDHAAGQGGKVVEAAGNLMSKCLLSKYNNKGNVSPAEWKWRMAVAAVETAAMAIRFLENLKLEDETNINEHVDGTINFGETKEPNQAIEGIENPE